MNNLADKSFLGLVGCVILTPGGFFGLSVCWPLLVTASIPFPQSQFPALGGFGRYCKAGSWNVNSGSPPL